MSECGASPQETFFAAISPKGAAVSGVRSDVPMIRMTSRISKLNIRRLFCPHCNFVILLLGEHLGRNPAART